MKQVTSLLPIIVLLSCNHPTEQNISETPPNVDSLTSIFVKGWNTQDSAAIMRTIADNAIVMNDSIIHKGFSAIAENWVSGGINVINNIKTSSLTKESDHKIAFDGGTYTLDLTPPGGPTLKEKGNYNLVWTKQPSGEWKLALVHIEDITRMPDIK